MHAVSSIYASDDDPWKNTLERARQQYSELAGVALLNESDFGAQPGSLNPFGFRDLISQPVIEGSGVAPLPGQGRAIKAGEFLLGYPGEAGAPLPMPAPEVLGRNGTFMVIRKYQSLVGTFNRFLHAQADTDADRERLAAKLFGRWRSGAPLTLAPDGDDPQLGADPERNNDFVYADDQDGKRVPLGAHMRRMNPRDTRLPLLTDVNLHRIVRRNTTFGPPYRADALSTEDDEIERGLYVILLSARAMETIEFLQREWINDGNSMNLGDERDPIVGLQPGDATFTIPRTPVRQRVHGVETFSVLRGGEYLFVPSLAGLQWLSEVNS